MSKLDRLIKESLKKIKEKKEYYFDKRPEIYYDELGGVDSGDILDSRAKEFVDKVKGKAKKTYSRTKRKILNKPIDKRKHKPDVQAHLDRMDNVPF